MRVDAIFVVLAALALPAVLAAQSSSAPAPPHKQQVHYPRHHLPTRPVPAPVVAAAPAPPPTPKPPDWPANNPPAQATVVWDSHGLRIQAANSSLKQILDEVSTETGAKFEGFNKDQRIFGAYGPGDVRDVLAQLLDGTGYNVLMVGEPSGSDPLRIVLSGRPAGPAPPPSAPSPQDDADNDSYQDQPEPPQPPVPLPAQQVNNNQGQQPRTPQQIMQEMLQHQQHSSPF